MYKTKLALNLSKTSIQLLVESDKDGWSVLGSIDPTSKNLQKELYQLKQQAAALTARRPVVDILLPRELILSQTIVIEDGFSIEYCKKVVASRCGLNETELLIAIGESTTKSTIPVAAISANSIAESRNFVKRAGFLPERYIASSRISGFKKSPVFFNDNSSKNLVNMESRTITKILATASMLLFAGFLASLTSVFLEFRENNKPYNYLLSSDEITNIKREISESEKNILNAIRIIQPISSSLSSFKSITLPEAQKFYPSIIFIPEDKSATIRSTEIQKNLSQKIQNIESFIRRGTNQTISVQKLRNLSKGIKQISMSKYSKMTAQSPSLNKLVKVSLPPKMDRTRVTKIEMDLFNKSKRPEISKSIENSLILKKVFLKPEHEKLKNFKYENVRVEEIFSDISLTKTLIKTADNKASSLPLVSLETKKPLIFLPSGTTTFEANISVFISPQKLLETNKNTFFVSVLDEFIETNINIDTTLGIKLSDFGIEILEQKRQLSVPTYSFKRWSGNSPTLKPKIIDTIKVLDDPTKSSGAVTFVELPPQMPQDVRKLKRISANSIKNLLVKNNPPSIPRRASIVGNSTLRNMIELNRTNLIGIFGKRKGRMALIRLSSGNTVKVSVGQEFGNGWRVIGIDLDKIHITNGNRQETLRIPG